MILSKQETSVEITDFNIIVVSAVNFSLRSTSYTHQSKCFNKFTTQSTCSNHKSFNISKFFLNFSTKNSNLVVVSTICWRPVYITSWDRFKNVIVQPLLQWTILACEFYYFLSNYATEKCRLRTNWASWINCCLFNHILINIFEWLSALLFSIVINCFCKLQNQSLISSTWIPVMFLLKCMNSSDCQVKLHRPSGIS